MLQSLVDAWSGPVLVQKLVRSGPGLVFFSFVFWEVYKPLEASLRSSRKI